MGLNIFAFKKGVPNIHRLDVVSVHFCITSWCLMIKIDVKYVPTDVICYISKTYEPLQRENKRITCATGIELEQSLHYFNLTRIYTGR